MRIGVYDSCQDLKPNLAALPLAQCLCTALTTRTYPRPNLRRYLLTQALPKEIRQNTPGSPSKPGRTTHKLANAYLPIALIETIAKVRSAIIAENLSYECEINNFLPNHQFGGWPGRSTTDALHYIEQHIKRPGGNV